jgi:catalase
MVRPHQRPLSWGGVPIRRRDLVLGATVAGGFLAVDSAALLYVNNLIGPARLTPHVFLDGFVKVFGRQPGFRKNHAKGVVVAGHFDGNGNGRDLSKAAVFRPGRTPVVGRFSLSGGNPAVVDSPTIARGLGLAFGFPGEQQWRTAMMNLFVFLDNSPQGFFDRMFASKAVPATGKPDPAAMAHFLAEHPETARAMAIIDQHPPTPGFADSIYRSLNTFYFVSDSGTRTPVRWSLVPLQRALPPATGLNGLFTPLIRQMRSAPLRWRLMLTVGEPSDPVDDPTLPWPADRRVVDAGLLTLTSIDTDRPGNERDINFDPLVLPEGIEPSDDPILRARSAVDAASYRQRTGEPALLPTIDVNEIVE